MYSVWLFVINTVNQTLVTFLVHLTNNCLQAQLALFCSCKLYLPSTVVVLQSLVEVIYQVTIHYGSTAALSIGL